MFFFSEERNPDLMRRGNRFTTDKAYIQRVESISSRFEFVCGDKDSDYIFLRCKDCGFIRRYAKTNIKPSHIGLITCNNCTNILKDIKLQEKANREKERMLKREQAKKKQRVCICKRCGKEFVGYTKQIYCSKICARRQSDANAEHLRRMRSNNKVHDVISLQMLVSRDKGKCWICGKKIDYSDHRVRKDGTFIAGKNYPSIDHVVALSIGGTHTWNNVRLAHMKCNNAKSNKTIGELYNGQMFLYL